MLCRTVVFRVFSKRVGSFPSMTDGNVPENERHFLANGSDDCGGFDTCEVFIELKIKFSQIEQNSDSIKTNHIEKKRKRKGTFGSS